MRDKFTKIVTPGQGPDGLLYVTIEWDGTRLSLTGVEGPRSNGDCRGSAGQCRDALLRLTTYKPGWDDVLAVKLWEVWDRWHLNDMRPGCVHQIAEGWSDRPIDPSKPTRAYGKHFPGQRSDSWNMLVWVRPDEHPDGLLTVPCSTCGYRYGTAWLHEDVPDDVLDFLSGLPDATTTHPWGK